MGLEPAQVPLWQVSVCVHLLPSSQGLPFAAKGFEQAPVVGSQVPAVWHGSLAVQTIGLEPVHVPFWQVSVCVHLLPSLQGLPFAARGFEQAPVIGSQVPATWHGSLTVQTTEFEPVQVPFWHVSVCVHRLPSS